MDLEEEERLKIALSLLNSSFSPRKLNKALSLFPPEEIFSGPSLLESKGFPEVAEKVKSTDWDLVKKIQDWCHANGVRLIDRNSANYPSKLLELSDPPSFLYVWGDTEVPSAQDVALIGTRSPSNYGRQVMNQFASSLARSGMVIVSGLARGLDSEAHKASLEAGGKTIAVLGSGFWHIYPPENQKLVIRIRENGCLLSEYPPSASPCQWYFPARNRLIAGLSIAVVVIEAGLKSGTLITCDFALELGREIYALPGSIFSEKSQGCHRLIKEGAKLVESAGEILEDIGVAQSQLRSSPNLAPEEDELLGKIKDEPMSIEDILSTCNLPPANILATLTLLEIKGLIFSLPGNCYCRRL